MKEVYITVTGTLYRYGTEMVEKGDILYLKKDTNNEYDTESIQVNHIPFGKIGYVANSVQTVIGECMSAGRLYDKIGQTAEAVVTFKSEDYIICKVVLDPSFSEVQAYQQNDRVGRTFSSLSHHGACRSALRGSIQIII